MRVHHLLSVSEYSPEVLRKILFVFPYFYHYVRKNRGAMERLKRMHTQRFVRIMDAPHMRSVFFRLPNHNLHRSEPSPSTGYTLPASIHSIGTDGHVWKRSWLQNGKLHRHDIDNRTGLVMPALVVNNRQKEKWQEEKRVRAWYNRGDLHREDRGTDGLLLPALITRSRMGVSRSWHWRGTRVRKDIDPLTGHAMHNFEFINTQCTDESFRSWMGEDKRPRRSSYDEDGNLLPAVVYVNTGEKLYSQRGIDLSMTPEDADSL